VKGENVQMSNLTPEPFTAGTVLVQ
jgi:hypothetical protein